MRSVWMCSAFALALAAGLPLIDGLRAEQSETTSKAILSSDGQRDFDFLVGTWKIHLKRRLRPLTGSNEWVEADGTVVCRQIWEGKGEVEEFTVDNPKAGIHIQGLATRLYDPQSRQWRIYWANERNGAMDAVPQIGQFRKGQGEFYAQDTLDGKPIFVRFSWSNVTGRTPHFEQAFSDDGGKSWEVNWITDQTRIAQ